LDRKVLVYVYGTTDIARAAEIVRAAGIAKVGVIGVSIFVAV
jgi:hypothetical protein